MNTYILKNPIIILPELCFFVLRTRLGGTRAGSVARYADIIWKRI